MTAWTVVSNSRTQLSAKVSLSILLLAVVFSSSSFAAQYVHGYYRSSGTYVRPYYRSSPNGTVTDNFSYKGNVNPYTGAVGTNRYIHDKTSAYFQGPDSHGVVGHASAPHVPQEKMLLPDQIHGYRDPNSVGLCPPPHFRMTERDGCQLVR